LPLLDGETGIEMDPDADYLTKHITERAVTFIEAVKKRQIACNHAEHRVAESYLTLRAESEGSKPIVRALQTEPVGAFEVMPSLKFEGEYPFGKYRFEEPALQWKYRPRYSFLWDGRAPEHIGRCLPATRDHRAWTCLLAAMNIHWIELTMTKRGSTFEGGTREPTVVRWPGKILAAARNDKLMTAMNLLPTFAKLAGADVPTDRVIDGSPYRR
jgi:hypothetical protein